MIEESCVRDAYIGVRVYVILLSISESLPCTCTLLTAYAQPDNASPEDRRRLVDEYGIRTIIDLRTKYPCDPTIQIKQIRA